MKVELIRQNKLKITLCKEDLSTYGISVESISKNTSEAQAMFFSVLKQAEAEVGFAFANARLVVEVIPSSDDLVLFVTKVDNEAEQRLFEKISLRQSQPLKAGVQRSEPRREDGRASYMAELLSFDDVVELCHSTPTYFGGTLYGHDTKYYMTVGAGMEKIVAEYGRILDEGAQSLIEEHAVPIIYRRAFDIIRNRFKV